MHISNKRKRTEISLEELTYDDMMYAYEYCSCQDCMGYEPINKDDFHSLIANLMAEQIIKNHNLNKEIKDFLFKDRISCYNQNTGKSLGGINLYLMDDLKFLWPFIKDSDNAKVIFATIFGEKE